MIRIIHTSDWHIGLELNGHNRLDEQAIFLAWLIEQCSENKIDALLIAGDIYDVNNPSIESQTLFVNFVVNFKAKLPKASLVIIGGNHDSGLRMEIFRPFAQALGGLHVIGSLSRTDPNLCSKHVIPLCDSSGHQVAWCLAVPFLRASDLDCRLEGAETVDQAFNRSISDLYSQLRLHAMSLNSSLPIIAMGHLTAMGSEKAGSERVLIGGVDSIPVLSISEGIDYVALGHIHKGQAVSVHNGDSVDKSKVQYCGSPLSMDFDERRYNHKVLLVDLDKVGDAPIITQILIPQAVEFIRFSEPVKTWDQIESDIINYDWSKWKDTPRNLQPFVDIQFISEGGLGDLRGKTEELVKRFPFRLVSSPRRIVNVDNEADSTDSKNNLVQLDLKSKDSPLSVFENYYVKKHNQQLTDELKKCFEEILAETLIQGNTK